jgi:hypothetical protein
MFRARGPRHGDRLFSVTFLSSRKRCNSKLKRATTTYCYTLKFTDRSQPNKPCSLNYAAERKSSKNQSSHPPSAISSKIAFMIILHVSIQIYVLKLKIKNEEIFTFHVLAVPSMKKTDLWDTAPCNLVEVDRRFILSLHHHPDDGGCKHL